MADRPMIKMGGSSQPSSPSSQPSGNAGSPAQQNPNTVSPPPTNRVSFRQRIGRPFGGLGRRIRRRPAVWWPSILVVVLLVFGVLFGGRGDGRQTSGTVAPKSSTIAPGNKGLAPPANIDELIVQSIVSIVAYERGDACFSGSGSVIGDGTYVLTNQHVIASDDECDVDEIRVQTVDAADGMPKDRFTGKVIASDERRDLAILSLTPIGPNPPTLRPLEFADSSSVGDDIVVVGFPAVGGDSVTVSKGIISGFSYEDGVKWIKTDAAVSGGNSGGAAVDSELRLVGVPTQFSQGADGSVTDCRNAADTNGDGRIDENDTCVGIGSTFLLMASATTAAEFAKDAGVPVNVRTGTK